MLLKLYKREEGTTLYWEAWDENDQIVVHFGELGQVGETTTVPLPEFEPPDTAIVRQAEEAREAGDGNDISDGTMNIYCYVVDPRLSLEPMVQELKENDLLRAAVVAFQDKDEHFVVLWPENWQGEFSY